MRPATSLARLPSGADDDVPAGVHINSRQRRRASLHTHEVEIDTVRLDEHDVARIRRGGLVIFPTETLYGLGCSAAVDDAIRRVFEMKGRAPGQPPPVLISDTAQLETLVASVPEFAQRLMDAYWPGSLTIVLPARQTVAPLLTSVIDGVASVGVRCTGHPVARALCEQVGTPVVATSANYSGATGRTATPHALTDIPEDLRSRVDVVIDGGEVAGQPSTVVDCSGAAPRVLRQGAVVLREDW